MRGSANSLMGLGCDCQPYGGGVRPGGDVRLGIVSDPNLYDTITVGGQQYSANQLLDKNLIAAGTVNAYLATNFNTPFITFKAGQSIGNVYSYIKADQSTAQIAGSPLLMFYTTDGKPYYVKDEAAISTQALKDAGTLTVAEETQAEADKQLLENSPIEYYVKKYAVKALLIGGGIYAAVQIVKALIDKPRTV